ncbi:MAG: tetratricopeptide repeat protein [Bacteroidales bacterium]|nr:tetratricopeptide repeat protein [Bacteroidales bacterium]
MKFKFIMFSSIIFFLLTACDSAETLVEKGLNEMADDKDFGVYEEKALKYFEKAIRKDSNCTQAYFERGKLNLKHGWDNCKNDFYKCVEVDPDNVEAWKVIATEESYSEQEKKIAAAVKALELDLEFYEAYLIIGRIAAKKNNLEKAEEYLIFYFKQKPFDKNVNNALGELRLKQERYYESYEAFQNGFYPGDFSYKALYHIKNAACGGNIKAKEYLTNINETDLSFFDEGKFLFEKKEFDRAMYYFRIAKNYTEFNINQRAEILAYIANIRATLASTGKYDDKNSTALVNQGRKRALEKAESEIEASLNIKKLAFAYTTLGDIKLQQGFYEDAINAYDSAILSESNNAALYINRAWALVRNHKHNEAISDINKAVSLEGKSEYNLWFRGDVYKSLGKNSEARQDFENVLKLNNKHYDALKGLAELEIQSGNYYKAYTHMQKVVDYYGKSQWIKEAMEEIPKNYLMKEMKDFKNSL